jgi:ABC-2 type transport system ATP-binding protein
MESDLAIKVTSLEKRYGPVRVLSGITFAVPRGQVFTLLGPNGAGKTTTVRILATLTRPDAGQAAVAGADVVREPHLVRRRISLTGQYAAVDGLQTGTENLRMMARLAGLPRAVARRRAAELTAQFGLTEAAGRRVGTYSGGMRRRLDLAASLVTRPEVVFLDEPTTGLDLPSRQATYQAVRELAAAGVTVFLTTQYLEDAEQLADRIAVLDGGQLVADGSPAALKQQVTAQRLDLVLAGPAELAAAAGRLGARTVHQDPGALTLGVATDGSAAQIRALLDEIDPDRTQVASFGVHTATLDDVFLALTGHAALASPTPASPTPASPTPASPPAQEATHV